MLASVIRILGNMEQAEEALQEACLAALEHWSSSGVPDSPVAWLMTTARRNALDQLRRQKTRLRASNALGIAAEM